MMRDLMDVFARGLGAHLALGAALAALLFVGIMRTVEVGLAALALGSAGIGG